MQINATISNGIATLPDREGSAYFRFGYMTETANGVARNRIVFPPSLSAGKTSQGSNLLGFDTWAELVTAAAALTPPIDLSKITEPK